MGTFDKVKFVPRAAPRPSVARAFGILIKRAAAASPDNITLPLPHTRAHTHTRAALDEELHAHAHTDTWLDVHVFVRV
ncbi:unnamed protein product [Colias eurytheme]|nr:unnamed protein product [Colias eurytheme]